jgi:hypothetical protein
MLSDLNLLSMKEQLYVCNVEEGAVGEETSCVREVRDYAGEYTQAPGGLKAVRDRVVVLSGKIEAEIALLEDPGERKIFLAESGLEESGLDRLIRSAYHLLELITFFTVNEKEAHARTLRRGSTAYDAAGKVHTDFQRGFIKAEVYRSSDLFEHGSEKAVREAGKYRTEGRDYEVRDGDIIFFKANP